VRCHLRLLLGVLVLLTGSNGALDQVAFRSTPVFNFDAADFVLNDSMEPPGEDATWRHVQLPDNWYVTRRGVSAVGWYRMQFEMPPGPYSIHTLYLPRGSARSSAFFLNGNLVTTARVQGDARALNWDEPLRFAVSPALLRPGRNVLHARVDAVADLRQGLASLTLGPSEKVLPGYFRRWALQVDSLRMFGGAALLASLIAFAFWARSRKDSIMFWFAVTALAWGFMSVSWFGPRFGDWGFAADLVVFPLRFAYAVPLLVLCLRLGGRHSRRLEPTIWLFTLCGALLMPFADSAWRGTIITIWSATYLVALIVLLTLLVYDRAQQRSASFWLLITAAALAAMLNAFDLARWMGWLNLDNPTLAHFHVPLVLLAIGATIVDRHFKAVAAVERSNLDLENQVAQKTREIEASYRRLREAERESVLAQERSRIMADMHDGVGTSLLSLLGMVQSGKAERTAIERRAQDALLELRLTVDSLGPVDGDLAVVLGNVRHRMREPIEDSGVQFFWQVGELPPLDYLMPRAILTIQRIVLEAIANALQHARAGTITVRAHAACGGLLIQVTDDGIGFDCAKVRRGRGLDNLQNRARSIGAEVEIDSAPRSGTRVTLTLPLPNPAQSEPIGQTHSRLAENSESIKANIP
jgi:signal transduction histidine kinase